MIRYRQIRIDRWVIVWIRLTPKQGVDIMIDDHNFANEVEATTYAQIESTQMECVGATYVIRQIKVGFRYRITRGLKVQ
jgi:hypothetical protein